MVNKSKANSVLGKQNIFYRIAPGNMAFVID